MGKQLLMPVIILFALLISAPTIYAVEADSILGTWKIESLKDDAAQVEIYKCEDKYCGKFTWLEDPEALDKENPDDSLKSRKLMGMDFVWGFSFDDDEWVDGNIYDPRSGKTWDCKMWYDDDTQKVLNVKGYFLFVGKTSIWYRI